MAANSRFAIAIHTLAVLAYSGESPVSSEMIATSVNTNPVVIRRIIGKFAECGLVKVQMGTGGGSMLTKPASEITLGEIYAALDEDGLFEVPMLSEDHCCPVGRAIRPVLGKLFSRIESKMRLEMQDRTLNDVMIEIREKMNAK